MTLMDRDAGEKSSSRTVERDASERTPVREAPAVVAARAAERSRTELNKALHKVLGNENSRAAQILRQHEPNLAKEPRLLNDILSRIEPVEQQQLRQLLFAETWAASVFHPDSYREISSGRTDQWEDLDPGERQMVAQKAEQVRGGIEGRKPIGVVSFWGNLGAPNFGCAAYFGYNEKGQMFIGLNYERRLKTGSEKDMVRSMAHEGEHANNALAMLDPQTAPHLEPDTIDLLRRNAKNYNPPGPTPEEMVRYTTQPIEWLPLIAEEHIWQAFEMFRMRNGW